MRKTLTAAAVLALLAGGATAANIYGTPDNFVVNEAWSDYSPGSTCATDGTFFGNWIASFAGSGGCTEIITGSPNTLQTGGSANAALVESTTYQGNADGTTGGDLYTKWVATTTAQNGAGHSYEVAWFVWNGHYDTGCSCTVFNYFILKPLNSIVGEGSATQGWELGTVYNSGGSQTQRFIASGNASAYPLNTQYTVEVSQSNMAQSGPGYYLNIVVNGTPIQLDAAHSLNYYNDSTNKYLFTWGWCAGLYEEAATVVWKSVYSTRL